MTNNNFVRICKELVVAYFNDNVEKTDNAKISEENVFIVWLCKTLQNHKALVSTTVSDGMYYEITYNGDKNEIYFDAYKKWKNECIKLDSKESVSFAKAEHASKEIYDKFIKLEFNDYTSVNAINNEINRYIEKGYVLDKVTPDARRRIVEYILVKK